MPTPPSKTIIVTTTPGSSINVTPPDMTVGDPPDLPPDEAEMPPYPTYVKPNIKYIGQPIVLNQRFSVGGSNEDEYIEIDEGSTGGLSGQEPPLDYTVFPEWTNDLSLPVYRPQAAHAPKFYLEGASHERSFTHAFHKHPWVVHSVRVNGRDDEWMMEGMGYTPYTRSPEWLANVALNRYQSDYARALSRGVSMASWALRDFGYGYSPNPSLSETNVFRLMHRSEDAFDNSIETDIETSEFPMVPWCREGILLNRSYQDEFWAVLKGLLDDRGLSGPEMWWFGHEDYNLYDYRGHYPNDGDFSPYDPTYIYGSNDVGWIKRALNDYRANHTDWVIDGKNTFRQWWDRQKFKDGTTTWPSSLPYSTFYGEKYNGPKPYDIAQKWITARRHNYEYSLWKSSVEIMLQYYPNSYSTSYQTDPIIRSTASYNPRVYVRGTGLEDKDLYTKWIGQELRHFLPGVQVQGLQPFPPAAVYFHEDPAHTYNVDIPAEDVRGFCVANFLQYELPNVSDGEYSDYVWIKLQTTKRYIYDCIKGGDLRNPLCPWLTSWTYRNQERSVLLPDVYDRSHPKIAELVNAHIHFLKYCISMGVRKFFIWESLGFNNTSSSQGLGENNMWKDILDEVKDWYDNNF